MIERLFILKLIEFDAWVGRLLRNIAVTLFPYIT